jgi:hypothetical protein
LRGKKANPDHIAKRVAAVKKNGKGKVAKRCLSKEQFFNFFDDHNSGYRICVLIKKYPIKQYQASRIVKKPELYSNWKKEYMIQKEKLCPHSL